MRRLNREGVQHVIVDSADQEWVKEHEPTAALCRCQIGGRLVFCVDLPDALCTQMFSEEERAWTAARQMVEQEAS